MMLNKIRRTKKKKEEEEDKRKRKKEERRNRIDTHKMCFSVCVVLFY